MASTNGFNSEEPKIKHTLLCKNITSLVFLGFLVLKGPGHSVTIIWTWYIRKDHEKLSIFCFYGIIWIVFPIEINAFENMNSCHVFVVIHKLFWIFCFKIVKKLHELTENFMLNNFANWSLRKKLFSPIKNAK